jgi:hypothetical protein
MMRLRRAFTIAALCVLASAATAYAECAWVPYETSLRRGHQGRARHGRSLAERDHARNGGSHRE